MKQLIGGRQRKIYTGPKGGTYYMKGGKKVYFKMKEGLSNTKKKSLNMKGGLLQNKSGKIIRTPLEFLVDAKLSRYSSGREHAIGLEKKFSLLRINNVTNEKLQEWGIKKPFHRLRFLRHARKLTHIPYQYCYEKGANLSNCLNSSSPQPKLNYGEFKTLYNSGNFNNWDSSVPNGNKLTLLERIFNFEDLNSGDFGSVQLLTHKLHPDKQYVMKKQKNDVHFKNECRVYTDLRHLKFIPIVHYTFTYEGNGYIIMEKLDKTKKNSLFDRDQIKNMLIEAYNLNWLIGLDLKRDNIMMAPYGILKLIDFGEAFHRDQEDSISNNMIARSLMNQRNYPRNFPNIDKISYFDKLHIFQMQFIGYLFYPNSKKYKLEKELSKQWKTLTNLRFIND